MFLPIQIGAFMAFENEFTYRNFLEQGREAEFDRLFDEAVAEARNNVGLEFPMFINGKEVYSNEKIIELSPIDGFLMGRFQKGTKDNAAEAVNAAMSSFNEWSAMPYAERVGIFRKAALLLSQRKFSIGAILSMENGKTRYESIGEVDEAIDFLNYYCDEMERNRGFIRRSKLPGTTSRVDAGFQGAPEGEERITIAMKPYGVFAVIAPFNFPVSISTGMSVGAMITGNTVVFKPSSTDNMSMLTGLLLYRLFKDAGVPDGVFNYITGPGSEVGAELSSNINVSGVVFTGSRATGMSMISKSYSEGKQRVFVVEMGGKNPAIVSKYADLDAAAEGIASAAFGFSGQKCSACSRVYVHESVKEEFIGKLLERTKRMKIGDPLKKENFIGPLISSKALDRYTSAVEEIKRSCRLIFGGNIVESGKRGLYVEPVVAEADHSNELMHKELFLPVLLLDTYYKFDEAIAKANDSEYGLTAGLYSRKRPEIKQFFNKINIGVVYVNRLESATTGAIIGAHTFVGWKGSGITGKGTGSRNYLQQFMREQSQSVSR